MKHAVLHSGCLTVQFTTCTNSGVHIFSFTVLKEMQLEILEPLHWLIL